MALCSCTSVDVVSILRKKREPLTSLTVSAVAEQAPEAPRVFTHIQLTYHLNGEVSPKAAEDAVALSKPSNTVPGSLKMRGKDGNHRLASISYGQTAAINFFRLVLAGLARSLYPSLISAVTTMKFAIHGAEVKVPDLQGLTVSEVRTGRSQSGIGSGDDRSASTTAWMCWRAGCWRLQSPAVGAPSGVNESAWVTRKPQTAVGGDPEGGGPAGACGSNRGAPRWLELEEAAQMPYSGAPPGHRDCAESAGGGSGA